VSAEQEVRALFPCGVKKAHIFRAQCEALATAYRSSKHAEASIEPLDELRRYLDELEALILKDANAR
jgi:hypothetical protein